MKSHPEAGVKAGFIAQEVVEVQPAGCRMASHDDQDHWFLEYQNLHAYSVKAIQALSERNKFLESENTRTNRRLAKIEQMLGIHDWDLI